MKKSLLIASAVAAGTAAIVYLIKRKRAANARSIVNPIMKRSHHRTDIFAKAKEQQDQ